MKPYQVGTRTVEPAPDTTTPEAALVDARNILHSARWQASEGPEAIYHFVAHACRRLDALIEAQVRALVARADDPEVRCDLCEFYLHPCRPMDDPVCRVEEYAAARRTGAAVPRCRFEGD